ncbi:MAG: glycosyltransferase family 2 protein [Melioribacteraceae bacterium]|nr:glycosyltransferase family 2 protein [Melioribacteraceae bacterium]
MNNQKIDISIIIVSYNSFEVLKNCLKTLIEYSKEFNYEIIIVDNNSTEGNVRIITDQFENIILIQNNENLGFAKANNQGLNIAKGEYILYLNNDMVFTHNCILDVLNYSKSDNKPKMIGCKLLNYDGSHQVSIDKFDTIWNTLAISLFLYLVFPKSSLFNKYNLNYSDITKPTDVESLKGAFLLAPKDCLLKLNGFDENFFFYGEEKDLCYRFKKIGEVIYYPLTSIIHLEGSSTKKAQWFKYKNQTLSKIIFFKKRYKGIDFFLILMFHELGILLRIPVYFLGGILRFNTDLFLKSYYYFKQLFTYPKI